MVKQIVTSSYDEVHHWILIAGTRGGFRLFAPLTEETEFMNDAPHYIYNPDDNGDLGIDYIYVKQLDGSVKWRDWATKEWKMTQLLNFGIFMFYSVRMVPIILV